MSIFKRFGVLCSLLIQSNSYTTMDEDDFQMFKIVVIGDSATGKTNISLRFMKGEFVEGFKSTVGVEFLNKVITVKGTKVKVTFWDTAGQEKFRSLSKVYYKGALGVIVVYDVTDQQTYLNVEEWMRLVNDNLNIKDVVIVILGNKNDKVEQKRVPFNKVLQDYKQKFQIECFQVSAKTGEGVQQSIMHLIQKIYKKNIQDQSMPDDDDYGNIGNSNYESVVDPPAPPPKPSKQQPKPSGKNDSQSTGAQKKKEIPKKAAKKPDDAKNQKLTDKPSKPTKKDKSCC